MRGAPRRAPRSVASRPRTARSRTGAPLLAWPPVALRSPTSRDIADLELLAEARANIYRASQLLERMFDTWPEDRGIARDILKAEQEGDRITQEIVRRLNIEQAKGLDSADIYALATQLDDIIDDIEEAADFMGLFQI